MRRRVDVRLVALRFAGWGLLAGGALGALFGLAVVLIEPIAGLATGAGWSGAHPVLVLYAVVFGALFGAPAGLVGGFVGGLLAGAAARFAREDRAPRRHRRRLQVASAAGFGVVTAALLAAVFASAAVQASITSAGDVAVLAVLVTLPVAIAAWVGWRLGGRLADDEGSGEGESIPGALLAPDRRTAGSPAERPSRTPVPPGGPPP